MKKILIAIFSIFVFMIIWLFFLIKPYEVLQEKRVATGQVKILTEYVNVTGDPNCTKLYLLESEPNKQHGLAIFPAVPITIPPPDDGDYAYAGNIFKLTGYPYEWVYRNSITGDERRERSQRFDVVKWEIIVPYTVWSKRQGEDDESLTEERSLPLTFELKTDDLLPHSFKMVNYIDCLAEQ